MNGFIVSTLGNGELLIPLNTNASWILNRHDDITIKIKNMNSKIKIDKIEFYALK